MVSVSETIRLIRAKALLYKHKNLNGQVFTANQILILTDEIERLRGESIMTDDFEIINIKDVFSRQNNSANI